MSWNEIVVSTDSRVRFVDVTSHVAAELSRSNVKTDVCYVYVPHTTAGVAINESADPDVVADLVSGLERMVPLKGNYRHTLLKAY